MSSARRTALVTPSDSVDLAEPALGLHVGAGGDLVVQLAGDAADDPRTFQNVPDGKRLEIAVTRVLATDTTAEAIVALLAGEGDAAYRGAPVADTPAWVQALAAPSGDLPSDALLFSDGSTKLDKYWSANAEQNVADLLTAISGFTFEPGDVSAAGLLIQDDNTVRPQATGTLLMSLCSTREQTLVFEVELTGVPGESGDGVVCLGYADPDPGSLNFMPIPLQLDWYPQGDPGIVNWEAANGVNGAFDVAAVGTGNAVWKIAVSTKDNSDVVSSFDGAATNTDVASEPDLGLPTIWKFGSNDQPDGGKPLDGYIRSIVRYPIQPDADLPTLSTP